MHRITIDMRYSLEIFTRSGRVQSLPFDKTIIALGTFDGVHTAHKALLTCAVELSKKRGFASGAWCFSDIPAALFNKDSSPPLTTTSQKIREILASGVDFVAVADFSRFKDISSEDFIADVIKGDLHAVGAVCGFNHRFGKGGAGDSSMLLASFGEDNTCIMPRLEIDGETVSSSAIRSHISNGEIERANLLLGRCLSFCTKVIEGKKLGRTLGFPTANLNFPDGIIIPKIGVYAVQCILEGGERYIGVANVGLRPTVEEGVKTPNCEVYMIGYSGELYDREICVEFHSYLREETKFLNTDKLSEAIKLDIARAEAYFAHISDSEALR